MESAIFGGALAIASAIYLGLNAIARAIKTRTVNVVFQNGITAVIRNDSN